MAAYRYQVVSVGWWRGKIKRWNTTFHFTTDSVTSLIHDKMQAVCYPNPGDVEGDCSGGIASIACYGPSGGTPLSNTIYFDWQTPSEWIPFLGTYWSGVAEGTPIDASGESALVIVGNMSGLSSTGKPVTTRKYIHAIPSRTASDYADPDVDATSLAAIEAGFDTGMLRDPDGVPPASVTVEQFYGNHQRVRGRRRTTSQVVAQSFSAGVVTGAGAGGGGSAPQFR